MSGMQNDFVGFTFNGVHSSELGIIRTSDGSRFNENLLPTVQDKAVQVPGGDGTYFFGSYYTQRVFNISFAFDNMTEAQFRRLKTVYGDKKVHSLVFDEAPYKTYSAKVTGSATIKHVCFEELREGVQTRIYRGEGNIQFTAYNPFARSVKKFLKDYDNPNREEWAAASGMRSKGVYDENSSNSYELDKFHAAQSGFFVYNPGDMPTDFNLTLHFVSNQIPAGALSFTQGSEVLRFGVIAKRNADAGVRFNTKMNLLEGVDANGNKTGTLYNDCITSGAFFKIPQTGIGVGPETTKTLGVDLTSGVVSNYRPIIEYDYLYI